MNIISISLTNFRSIGEDVLIFTDFKKYNLFIGKNNSGKSNIIRVIPFLSDLISNLPKLDGSFAPSINNSLSLFNDLFFTDETNIGLSVVFSITDQEKESFVSGFPDANSFKAELYNNRGNTIAFSFSISLGEKGVNYHLTELIWVDTPLISISHRVMRGSDGEFEERSFDSHYDEFNNKSPRFNYINVMLNKFKDFHTNLRIIKAVRKIGSTQHNDDGNTRIRMLAQLDLDGSDVIDVVSGWRSPISNYKVNFGKYEKISEFVSELLGQKIDLIISEDKNQLLIKDEIGTMRSYKSWGASVEELVVLMVDVLASPAGSIVAFEEPEIHLDPFMQRKLVNFLMEKTDHQYFISSHSNVFINAFISDSSSIFRVYKEKNATKAELANEKGLQNVLDDLGVKASDILQANGVIWVEGPSDRIFINKWIALADDSLKEGIHYGIMFYGGRLLSHLVVDVSETEQNTLVDDFIKLVKLSRNMVILMDSDRKSKDDDISETKKRIESEVAKNGERAMVWITDGREIENYIPPVMIKDILGIDGMDEYIKISGLSDKYVKINGAKKLVETMTPTIFKDNDRLKYRVEKLVERIKLWNLEIDLTGK